MFEDDALQTSLDDRGYARVGTLLSGDACDALVAMYGDDVRFRSRVVMERHNFGFGEYKYFADPLPSIVSELRERGYAALAPIANRWMERLGSEVRYASKHAEFRAACAAAGQTRPTPLILRYEAGGYNCLHQDLYGALAFPLQMVVMLSEPNVDYEGGEFVLVEQRPRMQSKLVVLRARKGEAIVFSTNDRPVQGRRGAYRVKMRHGVAEVTCGQRFALGIIFHDAAG